MIQLTVDEVNQGIKFLSADIVQLHVSVLVKHGRSLHNYYRFEYDSSPSFVYSVLVKTLE